MQESLSPVQAGGISFLPFNIINPLETKFFILTYKIFTHNNFHFEFKRCEITNHFRPSCHHQAIFTMPQLQVSVCQHQFKHHLIPLISWLLHNDQQNQHTLTLEPSPGTFGCDPLSFLHMKKEIFIGSGKNLPLMRLWHY